MSVVFCDLNTPAWLLIPQQITVIVSISVSIAMFCLIQLYVPVAEILAPHRPLMKLFAIKAVGKPKSNTFIL